MGEEGIYSRQGTTKELQGAANKFITMKKNLQTSIGSRQGKGRDNNLSAMSQNTRHQTDCVICLIRSNPRQLEVPIESLKLACNTSCPI